MVYVPTQTEFAELAATVTTNSLKIAELEAKDAALILPEEVKAAIKTLSDFVNSLLTTGSV